MQTYSSAPLIHVSYLKWEQRETGFYNTSSAILPTLALVLSTTVSLIGIGLDSRNSSPKLWLLFREAQSVSFSALPPAL